jgi:hypothetical protein
MYMRNEHEHPQRALARTKPGGRNGMIYPKRHIIKGGKTDRQGTTCHVVTKKIVFNRKKKLKFPSANNFSRGAMIQLFFNQNSSQERKSGNSG